MPTEPIDTHATAPRRAVRIVATGGTIASRAATAAETADYTVGIGIEDLLDAVPGMDTLADVSFEQFANIGSKDIGDTHLLALAARVDALLAQTSLDGIVITHGTDTLEESAFFLALTLRTRKPVVFVGAMRPASALSADGPMNLLQGIALAASGDARERGPLIVLSDRIGSAYYTTKRHANHTDAFDGGNAGDLGYFIGPEPYFYYTPALPLGMPCFDVTAFSSLPRVDIVYGHQGASDDILRACVDAGAAGLVVACVGNGSLPGSWLARVAALMAAGVPVVRATRTGEGSVTPRGIGIAAARLNPQKARIQLRLLLASGATLAQIERTFAPRRADSNVVKRA